MRRLLPDAFVALKTVGKIGQTREIYHAELVGSIGESECFLLWIYSAHRFRRGMVGSPVGSLELIFCTFGIFSGIKMTVI
jgi:hypothetical protein